MAILPANYPTNADLLLESGVETVISCVNIEEASGLYVSTIQRTIYDRQCITGRSLSDAMIIGRERDARRENSGYPHSAHAERVARLMILSNPCQYTVATSRTPARSRIISRLPQGVRDDTKERFNDGGARIVPEVGLPVTPRCNMDRSTIQNKVTKDL